ncbi:MULTISPECIES: hypothetical protein [unclassified Microcoleus]|uniref:hypothetical protein n=1 Tax=unclassified Microcoleus TaxID=2642155 RepID=UPI002FD2B85F
MKKFFQDLHASAERYMALPDKLIDTRAVFIAQIALCLFVWACISTAQLAIVNRCVAPLPSSFIGK